MIKKPNNLEEDLGPEQAIVLKTLISGRSVLLTGQAGTGKTFILNKFIEYLKEQKIKVGLTASTGIAATHIGGQTIHSWAGFGIREYLTSKDLFRISTDDKAYNRIGKAKVLIIDEISMLHNFQLDMVDEICRAVRTDERPFGGLQIVLCGDFHQLPPVSREGCGKFVTESKAWQKMDVVVCYLTEQYRQANGELLTILNQIRENDITYESVEILSSRLGASFDQSIELTKIYTHNAAADAYNLNKLEGLGGDKYTFFMSSGGKSKLIASLKKDCLSPEELILKEGAVVMFVRNNQVKGYVNGTTGRIIGFTKDRNPIVETFKDKKEIIAEPERWVVEENFKELAWISQIPLRLAWAITVHKSQGMTLDYVEIDLSRSFTYSLGYVALSRARSLEGISLKGFNGLSLRVSDEAIDIDNYLRGASVV